MVGVESTILDLSGTEPALLRPGGVPVEALEARIGPVQRRGTTRAPGTLASHYAPHTALVLTDDLEGERVRQLDRGLRVATLAAGEPDDHARRLYAELRRLDGLGVDVLVAERAAPGGLGDAINDRLTRAAHDHLPLIEPHLDPVESDHWRDPMKPHDRPAPDLPVTVFSS